jgi:uncharacterized membrane protein YcaP (DUF421 family)
MFLDSLQVLGRTLVVGLLAYLAMVVILRLTGKRSLSKWNAFDFIVTVALGSSLATLILSRDVSLLQGLLALALLCLLQLGVTWLSVRSERFQHLVKSTPSLLLLDGTFRPEAMRRERVTEAEIRSALRGQGIPAVEGVAAVILETDGTFSVIPSWRGSSRSALVDVAELCEGERGAGVVGHGHGTFDRPSGNEPAR